jgi:hypothetical protein
MYLSGSGIPAASAVPKRKVPVRQKLGFGDVSCYERKIMPPTSEITTSLRAMTRTST